MPDMARKTRCPDCHQCQECGKSRCNLCKKGGHRDCASELGSGFTYGRYLNWKKKRDNERGIRPISDENKIDKN